MTDPDIVMLWAACCLAFFGFLRINEMTGNYEYDPLVHLSMHDVDVDDPSNPDVIRVHIKQSKTIPEGCRPVSRENLSRLVPGASAATIYGSIGHQGWTSFHVL